MFGSIKPTASLSSGLLARKGQARPAMRPQGFHSPGTTLDDLGWNDMGADAVATPSPVVALTPASAPVAPPVTTVPPVLVERETLREEIETSATVTVPEPAPVAASAPVVLPANGKAKAAFTLRLDPARHLRLRLASASRNRSAQALVVEALDAFLATLPEVDGLAEHLTAKKTSRGKS